MKLLAYFGILISLLAFGSADIAFATDPARQEYDQMVEEAVRESDEYLDEKKKANQDALEEAAAQEDAALDERIQAEKERIQTQMDAIAGRGLSSTYTQGMKDNQLQQLQEKLDLLMSDPQAYFGDR
jgi:vacuolar-type H+-ATPase subunit E/Vma4